uniref:Uncharacterized protein n=1 Tax=Globodera pallida TaxID=36090 RepID=A0A183CAE0_GLOPA
MSLAYAVKGAEGMKIVADHFIFLLSARHLDYEIALHFKKIDNTTAETILTRFEMVDQSNKSKERPSICEESFVIDITAIDSGGKRKKLAGKGRPKEFNISYNIHQWAAYELTNNDNLCPTSSGVKGAEGMKIVADHFIFLLSARHLDYEIALHFKKIDNSTAETILTRFEMVDQSNKSKERPSICEESFVIDITAIDSGGKRKKLAGKGRPKEFNINYNIYQGATFDLTNNDNFCLFRAFEFLRMKFVLPQQRFSEYKRTASWQLNDVRVLAEHATLIWPCPF